MANIYLHPQGRNAATGSELDPIRSLSTINALLRLGDVAILADGDYAEDDDFAPLHSGTAEQPITLRGAGTSVILNGQASLSGRSHIVLDNLRFRSTRRSWLWTDDSAHISIEHCAFTSDNQGITDSDPVGTHFAFVGIQLAGRRHIFHHNVCGAWHGGNFMNMFGERHLVERNDASTCDNGHGIFMNYSSYSVIQDNMESNRWARSGEIASKERSAQRRNIYQRNRIFATNYDGAVQTLGWSQRTDPGLDGPGDNGIKKVLGDGTLVRGNLFVEMRIWPNVPAHNWWRNVLHIGNYNADNAHAQHMRMYHNTFAYCQQHVIGVTYNRNQPMHAQDNAIFNNVMHSIPAGPDGVQNRAIWFNADGPSNGPANGHDNYDFMDSWQVRGNLLANPIQHSGPSDSATRSVAEFEAMFPDQASDNIEGEPIFVNPDYAAALADRDLFIEWEDFALADGSPGKSAALPITTVTADSAGDTLRLGDTYSVTDGNDIIDGDLIVVNGQETRVIAVDDEAGWVQIRPAITARVGDAVWLVEIGEYPDIGIVGPRDAVEEPPVEEPEQPPVEPEPPARAAVTIAIEVVGANVTISVNGVPVEVE